MFQFYFDGKLLGFSALEKGDPPMGCAEGNFIPCDEFIIFRDNVPAEEKGEYDDCTNRWIGLTVTTGEGVQIECHDVVLFEYELPDEVELYVDVLGMHHRLYEELFPGRYAAYAASLS
ncbi:hypothetical protein [Sulfitobacter sp. 20_GPM-1509m]|uniref:hypothetical protein n=1 Tax=Sulfitobacter sp. 20_GPM-1509m TaxID=1380367 RepID=UPI0012DD406E|nr:hypothetical protein [Sulfitobacter sp. 20_GPM-1509m]